MLEWIAHHITHLIIILCALHLGVFTYLLMRRRRDTQKLKVFLGNIVREFSQRADIDHMRDLDDEIHFFITDIREVLQTDERTADRQVLLKRLVIKDEARPYLKSKNLETGYNVARTGIEAYPLLGILGTILAIAVGLGSPQARASKPDGTELRSGTAKNVSPAQPPKTPPPASAPSSGGSSVSQVVRSFLDAIWSTAAGLIAAIILMLLNAGVEPGLMRLTGHRADVREVVRTAKRELGLTAKAQA